MTQLTMLTAFFAGGPADTLVIFALSLPVAIVIRICFLYLSYQVERLDFEMRTAATKLLNTLAGSKRGRDTSV